MSSALFSSPLLRWIPIQSLVKIKKSLDKLGETPYDENGDIKGQETDSLVSAFKIGYFASASLVVIAIAGENQSKLMLSSENQENLNL
jgi:hypothetical protein